MTEAKELAEGSSPILYQVQLPLSTRTIELVTTVIRKHRTEIGSRWRKLPPGRQAIIVLAVLRHDQRLSDMAGGNGISASTVRRWVLEVIGLLARRAPRLERRPGQDHRRRRRGRAPGRHTRTHPPPHR
jgi:hypothetical protein